MPSAPVSCRQPSCGSVVMPIGNLLGWVKKQPRVVPLDRVQRGGLDELPHLGVEHDRYALAREREGHAGQDLRVPPAQITDVLRRHRRGRDHGYCGFPGGVLVTVRMMAA